MRHAWIAACAIVGLLVVASPAQAITNLYAPEISIGASNLLRNYAVAADGSLTPLDATPLEGDPRDIAVTPDGRFAYVTIGPGAGTALQQSARSTTGRAALDPSGVRVIAGGDLRGVLVNPQGTRVYYANAGSSSVDWQPINADGTLGAPESIALGRGATPEFLAMTPDGTSLYVADSGLAIAKVFQLSVDPASGAATFKTPAPVLWPSLTPPADVGRMTITPGGGVLYLTADTGGAGIARFAIDPATGALGAGAVEGALGGGVEAAAIADGFGEHSVAVSPSGAFLWAPSSTFGEGPGRVNQFLIGAGGALGDLVPASVGYVAAAPGPTREAVASPDGRSLYVGQDGSLGEWSIAAGGTLTYRASSATAGTNAGVVLAPSLAPVAAFTVTPQPAGQPTAFDARASADPDGSIVRYDWDFGDGTTLPNGGPTPSHVYGAAGTVVVALTVTDADGTSTAKLWTGARMLRNGGPSAQATRLVTISAAPPTDPLPTPPRPRFGLSITVAAERGTILVRIPGSRRYVPIGELTEVPLGSIVDARKGRARITSAVDPVTGQTQSAVFYDWYFKVLQTKGSKSVTEALLVNGSFANCTSRTSARAGPALATRAATATVARAAKAKRTRSRRKVRRLWGNGEGSFRTGGKRSSATVRGTWWLVEDRCDGTLTRVLTGRVDVRDFRLRKVIRLRSGRVYLAKAP